MRNIEDYREISGDEAISEIYRKARKLYGRRVLHINSTYQGGGVAEMLHSIMPLFNDIGIVAGWRILHGNPDFFTITKKFHNALQGEEINLTEMKKRLYIQTNETFSTYTHIDRHCVIIHDPQPLPLIKFYRKKQPWIWRCHVDLSKPDPEVWEFLKQFILRYDVIVVSDEKYKKTDLPVEQRVIRPAIDPLSPKNIQLSRSDIAKYLKKFGVPTDKLIVTQISRFDKWKDPEGVIETFRLVREEVDCRLVLCGNMATDDPEGPRIFDKVKRSVKSLIEKGHVVIIGDPAASNSIFINSLQTIASVVVQKSVREGFGLTVTEAMWKGKPVVASNIGGIPSQIKDGKTGFLLHPDDTEEFAKRIVELIKDEELAKEIGRKAKETVREKFLITRLISDHLDLLRDVIA